MVASAISYAVTCWGGSMKVEDTKRLKKLIEKAGSVVDDELGDETVADRRMLSRLQSIIKNVNHPPHNGGALLVTDELA